MSCCDDDEDTTNYEEDITVPLGTDLNFAFILTPFDGTGATGTFETPFGTFPVVLTPSTNECGEVETLFSTRIPYTQMPKKDGVYWYKVQLTWVSPASRLPFGHGSLFVSKS